MVLDFEPKKHEQPFTCEYAKILEQWLTPSTQNPNAKCILPVLTGGNKELSKTHFQKSLNTNPN